MKCLRLTGLSLLVLLCCVTAFAQHVVPVNEPDQGKPALFDNLPDKIAIPLTDLEYLLGIGMGKEVNVRLGQNTPASFRGTVVSVADNDNIHSVVIRSVNFSGATFTLSSSAQPNGTVKITGRIMSFRHRDLYELQNQNDQYILIKKNFYDLINE